MKFIIFVAFLALAFAQTVPFVNLWEEIKDPKCLVDAYKVFALRVYLGVGKVDPNLAKNVLKLQPYMSQIKQVGGYINPCVKCDPVKQVAEIVPVLQKNGLHMTAIFVNGEEWSAKVETNRNFLRAFIKEYLKAGILFAIATNEHSWTHIMGPDFTEFSQYALWLIHHDKDPENKGFKPFAGWSRLMAKQYDTKKVCGIEVDLNSQYMSEDFE